MGNCMGDSADTQDAIILQIRKIRGTLQLTQNRQKLQGLQMQKNLVAEFMKIKSSRNKAVQQSIIDQIVFTCNKVLIKSILIYDCMKIIDNKHLLKDNKNKSVIQKNFRNILYANSILGQQQSITKLQKMAITKIPQLLFIQDNEITDDIIKYHKKTQQVSLSMKTQYILNLCQQYRTQLSLQKINEIGHNFRYKN